MPNRAAAGLAAPETPSKRQQPHPGEGIPRFAWPTFALAIGALIAFGLVADGVIGGHLPSWVAILISTAVTYVMYSVAHEALHYSVSSTRWVNAVVGRLAWVFVVPPFSLPAFGYVHLQHHRYTNDVDNDPDMFATHGPAWQLPLRWALMDVCYATWYIRRLPSRFRQAWARPAAELAETAVVFSLSVVGLGAAILTGHFWTLAVLVVIPQRIGITILAWSFDWLPHHGLDETQKGNRYRATRIRVGMEWVLAPLMLSQNYHLIHHLHPWLPFYRYLHAWRRNEDAYLEHDPALVTAFGGELTPDEYRKW
ncbi:MAG TPA: fatty acid desaturase [Mycobacterium sp.]|nr:fatty acid desaturase [Mycobacterium sp.]